MEVKKWNEMTFEELANLGSIFQKYDGVVKSKNETLVKTGSKKWEK